MKLFTAIRAYKINRYANISYRLGALNMSTIQLFHNSPELIHRINESGLFGSWLFFSPSPGNGTCLSGVINYMLEIDTSEIIKASALFLRADIDDKSIREHIEYVASVLECDLDTAMKLLDESVSLYDAEIGSTGDKGELGWWLQEQTAELAKLLGYSCIAVSDEHGTSYMINMLGRENEWELVD